MQTMWRQRKAAHVAAVRQWEISHQVSGISGEQWGTRLPTDNYLPLPTGYWMVDGGWWMADVGFWLAFCINIQLTIYPVTLGLMNPTLHR